MKETLMDQHQQKAKKELKGQTVTVLVLWGRKYK